MVPDPPVTIDLTGGGVPWPAFTISGVEPPFSGSLNTTCELRNHEGVWSYDNGVNGPGGARINREGENTWRIANESPRFVGTGEWPWMVKSWTGQDGGAGIPEFSRALARPNSLNLVSVEVPVAARLSTSLTGNNNDLAFTSLLPGRLGNDVRVRYVNPGAPSATLRVSVSLLTITVSLATNGGGAITTTATHVKAAIEGNTAAAKLVTVELEPGNTGGGVVTAMNATALSGGTGGVLRAPVRLAL